MRVIKKMISEMCNGMKGTERSAVIADCTISNRIDFCLCNCNSFGLQSSVNCPISSAECVYRENG